MEKTELNQLVINNLRIQRIDADDRALHVMINLDVANKRIAELEEELKKLKELPP